MRLLRENKINWFDKRSGRYLTKELVLQLMMSNNQYYILFCLFVSPYSRVTFYFLWIIWIFFLRSLSPVKLYKRKKNMISSENTFFSISLVIQHLKFYFLIILLGRLTCDVRAQWLWNLHFHCSFLLKARY